ncbi:MAG: ABC transporter permease [Candidatus Cybelea sp.]
MHDYLTIFSEEVVRKLQSRPFRIALIAGVLLLAAITRLPSLLEHLSPSSSQRAIVIGSDGLAENAAAFLKRDFTIAGALAQGSPDATMLKSYNADTAIVLKQSGGSLAAVVYTKHPSATSESTIRRDLLPLALKNVSGLSMKQIKSALDMPVVIRPIASRFGSRGEEEAAAGMASGMLFLLYLAIIMNGQLVMSSAVEEKTSRIAELLIAVVNPSKLLAGKVLAATAVALLQLVVWIAALVFFGAGIGSSGAAAPNGSAADAFFAIGNITPVTIAAFVIFFLFGLLQVSMLMAAAGSLVSRTEDVGSLALPLLLPIIGALFIGIAAIQMPDAQWAVVASLTPIVSPFVMFVRIAVGVVPAWQIVLAIGINVAVLALTAWGSGRLYRVGMLLYGRAPTLGQIVRALRAA